MFQNKNSAYVKANNLFDGVDKNFKFNINQKDFLEKKEGEIIFRSGDPADYLYLVLSGEVKLKISGAFSSPVIIKSSKNEFFGEKELLENNKRYSSAVADSDCVLYRIEKNVLTQVAGQNRTIKRNLYKSLLIDEPEEQANGDVQKQFFIKNEDSPEKFIMPEDKPKTEPALVQETEESLAAEIMQQEEFEIPKDDTEIILEENNPETDIPINDVSEEIIPDEDVPDEYIPDEDLPGDVTEEDIPGGHIPDNEIPNRNIPIEEISIEEDTYSDKSFNDDIENLRDDIRFEISDFRESNEFTLEKIEADLLKAENMTDEHLIREDEVLPDTVSYNPAVEPELNDRLEWDFAPVMETPEESEKTLALTEEEEKPLAANNFSQHTITLPANGTNIPASADVKEFAELIYNDISYPVSTLKFYAEQIKKRSNTGELKEVADLLLEQAEIISAFAESTHDYIFGITSLKLQTIGISTLLDEVLGVLADYIESKNSRLLKKYNIESNVYLDKKKFYQALFQVTKVVIESMPVDGNIYVTTTGDDSKVHIEIRSKAADENNNLPRFEMNKLSGIGLLMANKIIAELGGDILINDDEHGSKFVVSVPSI